jgi:4'-phosphopantetheinyl transferase EntD
MYNLTRRPHKWGSNPINSLYLSEEEAAAKSAKYQEKYEAARTQAQQALQQAKQGQAAAAAADFENPELNKQAQEEITQ